MPLIRNLAAFRRDAPLRVKLAHQKLRLHIKLHRPCPTLQRRLRGVEIQHLSKHLPPKRIHRHHRIIVVDRIHRRHPTFHRHRSPSTIRRHIIRDLTTPPRHLRIRIRKPHPFTKQIILKRIRSHHHVQLIPLRRQIRHPLRAERRSKKLPVHIKSQLVPHKQQLPLRRRDLVINPSQRIHPGTLQRRKSQPRIRHHGPPPAKHPIHIYQGLRWQLIPRHHIRDLRHKTPQNRHRITLRPHPLQPHPSLLQLHYRFLHLTQSILTLRFHIPKNQLRPLKLHIRIHLLKRHPLMRHPAHLSMPPVAAIRKLQGRPRSLQLEINARILLKVKPVNQRPRLLQLHKRLKHRRIHAQRRPILHPLLLMQQYLQPQ